VLFSKWSRALNEKGHSSRRAGTLAVAAGKRVEVVNGVSNAMHVAGKKNRFLVIAPMPLHADRVAACRWGSGHPRVVSY
jgi:hypothetical protein